MAIRPQSRAVLLDKDGTIVEDIPYNVDPTRLKLAEGAGRALRQLQRAGFKLIVVTNQSGIARGLITEQDVRVVERALRAALRREGVELEDFYFCPHHPNGVVPDYSVACDCRKPRPGMLERAARDHGIALEHSWMVGDILDDVEAGRRAGCRTVLVGGGNETVWRLTPMRAPHVQATDLAEAARAILTGAPGRERRRRRAAAVSAESGA